MHFDLNLKSLTMSGFEIPPLIHLCPFQALPFPPSPFPAMGTILRLDIVIFIPTATRVSALKLPQRVRAQPCRQTFLMQLCPDNDVWERLSSLIRLLSELCAKHAF